MPNKPTPINQHVVFHREASYLLESVMSNAHKLKLNLSLLEQAKERQPLLIHYYEVHVETAHKLLNKAIRKYQSYISTQPEFFASVDEFFIPKPAKS